MADERIVGWVLGIGALAGGAALLISHARTAQAASSPRSRGLSGVLADLAHVAPRAPEVASPSGRGIGGLIKDLWDHAKASTTEVDLSAYTGGTDPDYPLEVWAPIVVSLVRSDYPRVDPRVAMRWIQLESDGAPCAFGKKGQQGPDGQPREIGLGQLYNDHDFKTLGLAAQGVTPSTFRAYCASHTQLRTRKLTAAEMDQQVRHTVLDKIDHSMGVADAAVTRHHLHWTARDYWALVKLVHGLPSILSQGLPAVVKKLGRAPSSWAEFRHALGMDVRVKDTDPRSKTYGKMIPKYPQWTRALDNAEALARAVAVPGTV